MVFLFGVFFASVSVIVFVVSQIGIKLQFLKKILIVSLLFVTPMTIVSASIIDTAERFWTFDGTFNDSVDGVVGNGTGGVGFGQDRDGNANGALSLDGYDDKVWISASSDLTNVADYTLSFWFKMSDHNAAGRTYLFDTRGPGSLPIPSNYLFIYTDGSTGVQTGDLRVGNSTASNVVINDNTWHHLAFVYSSGIGSSVYLDQNIITDHPLWVGSDFSRGLVFGSAGAADVGGNYWLNGAIDDAAFWSSALTPDEIQELFEMEASASVPAPNTTVLFLFALLALMNTRRLS